MIELTPVSLRSVAVVGARCGDIATGLGATLIEIARDEPDLVVHALILTGGGAEWEVNEKNAFAESVLPDPSLYLPIPIDTAHRKARLLAQCHSSQPECGWRDDEAILGLMRVRGVQCRTRYAEAFTIEQSVPESAPDYSVN